MDIGELFNSLIGAWGGLPLLGKIFAILLIASEGLSFIPSVKANGVFQAIRDTLKKLNPFTKK